MILKTLLLLPHLHHPFSQSLYFHTTPTYQTTLHPRTKTQSSYINTYFKPTLVVAHTPPERLLVLFRFNPEKHEWHNREHKAYPTLESTSNTNA